MGEEAHEGTLLYFCCLFFSLASCNALNLGNVEKSPIASLGAKLVDGYFVEGKA